MPVDPIEDAYKRLLEALCPLTGRLRALRELPPMPIQERREP